VATFDGLDAMNLPPYAREIMQKEAERRHSAAAFKEPKIGRM
jgi:hypothetical protein